MRDRSRRVPLSRTALHAWWNARPLHSARPAADSNHRFFRSHHATDPSPTYLPTGPARNAVRAGFTLLEVILALAILAGALASLGEVVRLSGENANMARDLTTAQLLAASKLAAITSGAEELSTVERAALDIEDADPPWLYSVQWDPTDVEDLIVVRVRVEQDLAEELHPVRYTLVRWMPDPGAMPVEAAAETSASSSSSSSASGSEGS